MREKCRKSAKYECEKYYITYLKTIFIYHTKLFIISIRRRCVYHLSLSSIRHKVILVKRGRLGGISEKHLLLL
jgi:hypothetical protein